MPGKWSSPAVNTASFSPLRLDLTPLVGIILALVMIMMVSQPTPIQVSLDMPPDGQPNKPVNIVLDRHGAIFVNSVGSSAAHLAADLKAARPGALPKDTYITLQADDNISYQAFFAVVDELHKLGYDRLGLPNTEAFWS